MADWHIVTEFTNPPIPIRSGGFDWSATLDNYEADDPIGRGRTELDAIQNLIETLIDNGGE